MACAVRERALAIRESELKRNRQLAAAGGEPGEVSPKPEPVSEALAQRVEEARTALEKLKSEEGESYSSPTGQGAQLGTSQTSSVPRIGRGAGLALVLVALLSVPTVNLPIFVYGVLFDRIPNLLSGAVYFVLFLALAVGATKICEKLLPLHLFQAVELRHRSKVWRLGPPLPWRAPWKSPSRSTTMP